MRNSKFDGETRIDFSAPRAYSRIMTQESLWQAVERRDSGSAAKFVYAVVSTGIYCRADCPSRRPDRRNVRFYDTPREAEAAGFRPCRRCRPDEPDKNDLVLKRAVAWITENVSEPFSLDRLGASLAVSPRQLHRLFRDTVGVTPRQYAAAARLDALKSKLRDGEPVTGAMYDAGYGSSSRLYESASSRLGMTPAVYRKRGAGLSITWDIGDTTLGRMLVASTERGICALYFGDSDSALEAALAEEYPAAKVQRAPQAWMEPLASALAERRPAPALPLDAVATAFQARVWEELRRIPYGETATYSDIAARIGKPEAVRAVANACAHNPVSLLTPCHRVLRREGTLGGYRWGLDRKRRLLEMESDARQGAQQTSRGATSRTESL